MFRHEQYSLKVDVYSYAMIVFQLFENSAPFSGMDPIQAARDAAMMGARPNFPPRNKLDAVEQVSHIHNSCHGSSYSSSLIPSWEARTVR